MLPRIVGPFGGSQQPTRHLRRRTAEHAATPLRVGMISMTTLADTDTALRDAAETLRNTSSEPLDPDVALSLADLLEGESHQPLTDPNPMAVRVARAVTGTRAVIDDGRQVGSIHEVPTEDLADEYPQIDRDLAERHGLRLGVVQGEHPVPHRAEVLVTGDRLETR